VNKVIDVENLTFKYGDFPALQNVSFSLEGEKIYGLLGRNGAGKTSLLSLVAGFREPNSGSVKIEGEKPFENPEIMQKVIFLQDKYPDADSRVDEILQAAESFKPNWDKDYARTLIKRFELPRKKTMEKLSKGMQSALRVVLGLASRAPVTIFDETHLGMDAPSRYVFYEELLKEYMEHPRTFILSTHLIGEIASYLEEVVIIDKGQLVLQEEKESLLQKAFELTGPQKRLDQFIEGMNVLREKQLGGIKSVLVFDELSEGLQRKATDEGLETGEADLQDLFVYLTGKGDAEYEVE